MTEHLSYEELKVLVLDVIRQSPKTQFENVICAVEERAKKIGKYKDNESWGYSPSTSSMHEMPKEDREKIVHILWELIFSRIIIPGTDDRNYNLPFIQLTEFGKEQLNQSLPTPYDPDKFLKSVKQIIDDTTFFYLSESLRCYHSNCNTASAVMLGTASENLILNLCNELAESFQTMIEKSNYTNKLDDKDSIAYKYSIMRKQLEQNKKLIPKDIADNLQLTLDGVFDMIRSYRNESGHPTGKMMEREAAFANMQIFRHYARKIFELTNFLKTKPNFRYMT